MGYQKVRKCLRKQKNEGMPNVTGTNLKEIPMDKAATIWETKNVVD